MKETTIHVALVNLAQPPGARSFEAVLEGAFILVDWARALAGEGLRVTAIQGCQIDASFTDGGVDFELVNGPFEPFLHPYRVHRPTLERLATLRPDVVHLNSLLYGRQLFHARKRLPESTYVVQHHAERPADGGWRRFLQRRWLKPAHAFVWNGLAMAAPWRATSVLPAHATDHAVAEGSVHFAPAGDRARARRDLGIDGAPMILCLGRLDANKDPLTVLRGLEPVLESRPDARAIFCFKGGELEMAVRDRIMVDDVLRGRVELRGHVPYEQVERYVQAADVMVQGSHREGSSFALIEAFACGVVPVMTDIPSIRFLVGDALHGEVPSAFLWPTGDSEAMTRCLEIALDDRLADRQAAARQHFERHLAYPVLARQMIEVYHQAMTRAPALSRPAR